MSELTLALSALTGGAAGALDKIDGAGLSDGDAAVVVLGGGVYHYHLNATSGATENSPYVISPDTNAGTKRWVLVYSNGPATHVEVSRATAQAIASGTDVTMVYNVEAHDLLSEYNTSTGVFTAANDGVYLIMAFVTLASTSYAALKEVQLSIKNGSTTYRGGSILYQVATTAFAKVNVAKTLKLAATDTLEIIVRHALGSSIDTYDNASYNHMTISRIA